MRAHAIRARRQRRSSRNADYAGSVRSFFRERLEFYLRDARGYAYDVVNAVLAADADDVVDAVARAEAVKKVRGSADFESISHRLQAHEEHLAPGGGKDENYCPSRRSRRPAEESEKELAALISPTVATVEKLRGGARL